MKLLLVRCAICYDWYAPVFKHCRNCGALRVAPEGMKPFHLNAQNIEIVRGLPADVDGMLNRFVKYVSRGEK